MFGAISCIRAFTGIVLSSLLIACGGGADPQETTSAAPLSTIPDKAALATSVAQFSANGWYWNPAEGGTGFMFEAQGNRAFVAFFLYEDVTRKPVWYAAYGGFTASDDGSYQFSGELRYYSQGQAVTNPVYPRTGTSRSIGDVRIRFVGNNANVQLPGGRSIAGTRFDIAKTGYDFNRPTPNKTFQPEVGWYWNPDEGGRGYAIEVQNDKVFMAMFHYNEDGSPTWNILDTDIASGVANGGFLHYQGGQTLTSAYRNPEQPYSRGRFTMSFRSACAGQLQFEGMPAVRVRRFVVDGSPLASGAECRSPSVNWLQAVRFLLIEPGDSVFGTTGNPQPGYDSYRIELVAGTPYTIDLKGRSSGAGTLADPVLELEVAGTVVASNDNREAGTTDAQIRFTPSITSAFYYIRTKAKSPDTGSFLLSVSGVGKGLVKQPTPALATYAGLFKGRFSGQRVGSMSFSISASGTVTGTATVDGGTAATVSGRVTSGGLIQLTTSGAGPFSFNGFLSPSGPVSGAWSVAADGSAGQFVAVRSGENLLDRLYGQVNLSYGFGSATTAYSERTVFSAANLNATGPSLINFVTGSTSREIACFLIDAAASVTTYACVAKYNFSSSFDLFLFNLSNGQVVNGLYEYCLSGTDPADCTKDLLLTPDGSVTGSVTAPGSAADKGVAMWAQAVDPAAVESAKAGAKLVPPVSDATLERVPTHAEHADRLVQAMEALSRTARPPAPAQ